MKGVTTYQLEVLRHTRDNPDIDFDQLLDMLSWTPSKESAQFVIRALVQKKLIEKGDLQLRRGRKRVTYRLTQDGHHLFDPRSPRETPPSPKTLQHELVTADISEADLKDLLPGLPDLNGEEFNHSGVTDLGVESELEIVE